MRTVHNIETSESRRKTLRKNATPQEAILWSRFRREQLGFKFSRQHGIGNFIVDFYCAEARLVIEIDGGQHIDCEKYDRERTDYLTKMGYKVIRFWNNEVNTDIDEVVMRIMEELNTTPLPRKLSAPPLN